jgi:hypothetical protein
VTTQVFSPTHIFTGNKSFQNGLLQLVISGTLESWYAYDGSAWKHVGNLRTIFTDGNDAVVVALEIKTINPDVLIWTEVRMYLTRKIELTYTLRRGCYHCRVSLQTFADAMNRQDAVFLDKGGGFTQLFNAGANGAGGAGSLATSASANYGAGYNTADKLVIGFAQTIKPSYQPYDSGTSFLSESNVWAAGTTQVFSLFAYPCTTSSFVLATERANCAAIAAESLGYVKSRTIPLSRTMSF